MLLSLLLISAALICFYLFKMSDNGNSQYIIFFVFIIGLLFGLFQYRQQNQEAGFKQLFGEGFKIFVVVAFFMVVYSWIFYKYNPQILEEAITFNEQLIIKQGNRTMPEIEDNTKKLRQIFIPMMLAFNTIKYLFMGTLVTLVASGFWGKRNFYSV
jgi:type III secretory pathway component EscS